MILGLSVEAFTQFHVLLSLVGIAAGFVVLGGLCTNRPLPGWTAVFPATTVLTSATGFLFHSKAVGPPHVVGAISLVVLLLAIVARYACALQGAWRGTYVIAAVLAFYLNGFVGVVQAFQKIAPLHALAPTGSELPFAAAQGLVLLAFVAVGVAAYRNFRPAV
jgi:hypothetical protein